MLIVIGQKRGELCIFSSIFIITSYNGKNDAREGLRAEKVPIEGMNGRLGWVVNGPCNRD